MMDNFITREEHTEFCRRVDAEDHRQNRRIEQLEETVREISKLTSNVEKLAINMEHMLKNQELQGERLETLEGRDGEMWRKVAGYVVTTLVGLALGYIFQVATG